MLLLEVMEMMRGMGGRMGLSGGEGLPASGWLECVVVAVGAAAFVSGALIAGYVPWVIAMGLRWIIPDEQPRFLIVVSIANLHLIAAGLLLIWLGLRLWKVRPPAAA